MTFNVINEDRGKTLTDEDYEVKRGRPLSSQYSVELGFPFNKRIGSNLERLRNAVIHQDYDVTILVDGQEGAGKSVFALQIAYFLDIDRNIDIHKQVCYYPEQFKKAVSTLGKGKAIIWDEARRGLNRRRSMEKINIDITDMLAECRYKNLFIIVVMPSFFDMDINVAIHRSELLFNVYVDWKGDVSKPLRRGFVRMYSKRGKADLHQLNRRYSYPFMPNESFDATFSHYYVVDEDEYRKLKIEAFKKYQEDAKKIDPHSCPSCGLKNILTRVNGSKRCRSCGLVWERGLEDADRRKRK